MSTVTYFELHTPDADQAAAFYGKLFGWQLKTLPLPMRYDEISTQGAINGGAMQESTRPYWLQYIGVDDLDASLKAALALGGKVLQPKTEVKGQGHFAVLADPAGATFAMFQKA